MVIVRQMAGTDIHEVEIPKGTMLKVEAGTLLVLRGSSDVVAVFGAGTWLSAYDRERSGRSS